MSWFFGKKKHHRESPTESPVEPVPSDEAFVIIDNKNQGDIDSDNNTPGLYPSLNDITPHRAMPSNFVKQGSQDDVHDLNRIPFKLCEELERELKDSLVIDKLRLDEISSFFKKINMEDYEYTFNLERSVINEMDSQNEE